MSVFETPLIMGMRNLPANDRLNSPRHLADWIEARLDDGLCWFDHADIYGAGGHGDHAGERLFGEALAQRPALAGRVRIVTKIGIVPAHVDGSPWQVKHYATDPAYLESSINAALRRLNVDHIDLLLLHRPDPLSDIDAVGATLDSAIDDGRLGSAGVSNHLPAQWRRLQAAMRHSLAGHQIELSIARSQLLFDGLWDAMRLDGLPGMAWSPLCGGRLFENQLGHLLHQLAEDYGATPAGVALAWLRRIPNGPVPVVGTLRPERLRAMRDDAGLELTRTEWFALLEAARACRVP
ncbi:putative oxidoreductase [Kushneria sinocarnis]|uniref:Putative oxidoreductase n=1 Tax=Kushneria sinocarnis TaxID=595502 RepID=A0A420WX67_9GAMM|nr:aldo/keto reductase [Kushneria sinocarnis]RKR04326.1 putative oxidoreductase [Kushneria sinocarnis]